MKKFIVSDLHGNYLMYENIINYLTNLTNVLNEDITLYINGDLIDRGYASIKMLLDVKKRIEKNNDKLKIEYLVGNHEKLMYDNYTTSEVEYFDLWMKNGGDTTYKELKKYSKNEIDDMVEFISNLKVYHKFDETIRNKQIVLVHAKCPEIAFCKCPYTLKENNNEIVYDLLWTRKKLFNTIGNSEYFTIIGHTPLDDEKGCSYNKKENCLNIDGGCAAYVSGLYEYDHTPLVEIENEKLTILTFTNDNEIVTGNYFINESFNRMDDRLLKEKKELLKKIEL